MIKYNTDDNEIIRLTISLGIVATAIGIITLGPSMNSSIIIALMKIGALLLVVSSFTYIMLTGLQLKYKKEEENTIIEKFLNWLRKKAYNFSVSFYWYAFFSIIWITVTEVYGISVEDSRNFAFNILFYILIAIILAFMIVVYLKKRQLKKIGDRH